ALGVRLSDRVRQIEEDITGELVGLGLSPRAIELLDEREELDRERRRAHEHIALALDLDRASRGIAPQAEEIPGNDLLRRREQRLEVSRYADCPERHRRILYHGERASSCATIGRAPRSTAPPRAWPLRGSHHLIHRRGGRAAPASGPVRRRGRGQDD